MADLKYQPVSHDHEAFLAKARSRKGFADAYDSLAFGYEVAGQMPKAGPSGGRTQSRALPNADIEPQALVTSQR